MDSFGKEEGRGKRERIMSFARYALSYFRPHEFYTHYESFKAVLVREWGRRKIATFG